MIVSPSVSTSKTNQVCKIFKSLYGIKQAKMRWHGRLTTLLIKHHYKQVDAYHSLFFKNTSSLFIMLLVYVDNVIIIGNDLEEFKFIKEALRNSFKIKDLDKLNYFLGIEVTHSKDRISLCQRKYCLNLLGESGLTCSKLVPTSYDPLIKLHHESMAPYHVLPTYRILVGKLLYLNTFRPDITFCTK